MNKAIIRNILKVFAVGGTAVLMAAFAILMGILSVELYCSIPSVVGYIAVLWFALATLAAVAALAVVYVCGAWMVRKGKFEK